MKSISRGYIWWPGIDNDIEITAGTCKKCIQVRPMPKKTALHTWKWPKQPLQRLHANYLVPFKGNVHLIIEDAFSKWIKVFNVPSISTYYTIHRFKLLFARFGIPEYLVTDNGSPFSSIELKHFFNQNEIKQITSSPYYPQSYGQAESGVKIIKSFLKK